MSEFTETKAASDGGGSSGGGGGGGGGGAGGFGMSAPVSQGKFGQCATYAFSRAVAEGLRSKYAISILTAELRAKMEYACPDFWNGVKSLNDVIDGWNTAAKAKDDKFCFADQERERRYSIKVEGSSKDVIHDVSEAYERAKGLLSELLMVVVVEWPTEKKPNGLHAIVVDKAYEEENTMRGLNSHGQTKMIKVVNEKNFKYAFVVDPVIQWVKDGNGKKEVVPRKREGYVEYFTKFLRYQITIFKKEEPESMKTCKGLVDFLKENSAQADVVAAGLGCFHAVMKDSGIAASLEQLASCDGVAVLLRMLRWHGRSNVTVANKGLVILALMLEKNVANCRANFVEEGGILMLEDLLLQHDLDTCGIYCMVLFKILVQHLGEPTLSTLKKSYSRIGETPGGKAALAKVETAENIKERDELRESFREFLK